MANKQRAIKADRLRLLLLLCLAGSWPCYGFATELETVLQPRQVNQDSSEMRELRDPTKPPDPQTLAFEPANMELIDGQNGLELTAIFASAQRKLAIINGHMMKVGDTQNNITVLDIQGSRVMVRDGKNQIVMLEPYFKIPAVKIRTQDTEIMKGKPERE